MLHRLLLAILAILIIFVIGHSDHFYSGYFVKHLFLFQHILNVNLATIKNHFKFFLFHVILF